MPRYAKRKFTAKRRTYRKRPSNRRRGVRTSKKGYKVHYFTRVFVTEHTITNAGFQNTATLGAIQPDALSNLDNYAEYQAMFDEFKIKAVSKKFIFNRNSANVATASSELPQLITYNDYNDGAVIASEVEALQVDSFKTHTLSADRPVTRYYKPKVYNQVYTPSGWQSTSDHENINHFGLKWAVQTIDNAGGTTLGTLRIYTKYYLSFRGTK